MSMSVIPEVELILSLLLWKNSFNVKYIKNVDRLMLDSKDVRYGQWAFDDDHDDNHGDHTSQFRVKRITTH